MIFDETFEVAAGRQAVAALFGDVAAVSRCVPGIEDLRPLGDDRYRATLRLRVGPIAARFSGDLEMDDSQSPERFSATGSGADARTGSQVEVAFTGDLEPIAADRTRVTAHVDVALRGRLGQFGTGIIEATGQQLLGEFVRCLNATVTGGERAVAAAAPSLWRVLLRGAGAWLRRRVRNLRRRAGTAPQYGRPRPDPTGGAAPPAPGDAARAATPGGRPVFVAPPTVEEVCATLDRVAGAKLISGGTAVVLMMQQGLIRPDMLVSLGRIGDLRFIERGDGVVRIGGGTTLTEIAASPLVRAQLPSLAYACHRVGNVRIRNVATLGGNLAEADYASDPPAVLASLGATCTARGTQGSRTIPVMGLITGFYETSLRHGEVITEIRVPAPSGERRVNYQKYISRSSEDRPCVGVAARGDFDGPAIADLDVVVGAVAPVLQRLPDVTAEVAGRPLDGDAIAHVSRGYAQRIEPMSDARGSAWYRRRMIEVFVRRALESLRMAPAAGGAPDRSPAHPPRSSDAGTDRSKGSGT
jgi:carbon-monoxide dehydrogenase medium subunit